MKLTHDLRKIVKPVFLWILLYSIFSVAFVALYVYIDYQCYLSSYQTTQQAELKEAQSTLHSRIENLKKLSVLTGNRIVTARGDLKRIQSILNSSYSLLPDSDYFKIEKITYNKLSKPQNLITRFGTLSLKSGHVPLETPHQSGPTLAFHKTSITTKNWIFNSDGVLEGFLEISLDPSYFKATLPIGPSLSFSPLNTNSVLFQQKPFPIYGKAPDSFCGYAVKQREHYLIFFSFMLFCLFAMAVSSTWQWRRIHKVYKEEIKDLENAISASKANLEKTQTALFDIQQRLQVHQDSFQAYKKFQANFRAHQREQIAHLLRSLDVIMNFSKRPNSELLSKNLVEIIESCLKVTEHLCDGVASKMKNESIKVIDIIDNILELFTEKIHKSNLDIEVNCSENLLYEGDSFLTELILINVIGKPLHSVPPNGKVVIKATNQKEALHIQVKDNGYFFDKKILNQLNQSFDFFLSQEIFRKFCQENNLLYEHHRTKSGFNTTKISFPKFSETTLESNVVPFSRGR